MFFCHVIHMSDPPATFPLKKLSIWNTIREGLEVSWRHRTAFVPWMVLWAVIAGLSGYHLEGYILDIEVAKKGGVTIGNSLIHTGISFLFWIFQSVVFALFAVLWHRRILLGKKNGVHLTNIGFSQRNLDFVLSLVGVFCRILLWLLPGICIWVFINYLWGDLRQFLESEPWVEAILKFLIITIPCVYLIGRYCLVFPAIAVDFRPIADWTWPKKVNWSWSQSKENEWQLA